MGVYKKYEDWPGNFVIVKFSSWSLQGDEPVVFPEQPDFAIIGDWSVRYKDTIPTFKSFNAQKFRNGRDNSTIPHIHHLIHFHPTGMACLNRKKKTICPLR